MIINILIENNDETDNKTDNHNNNANTIMEMMMITWWQQNMDYNKDNNDKNNNWIRIMTIRPNKQIEKQQQQIKILTGDESPWWNISRFSSTATFHLSASYSWL